MLFVLFNTICDGKPERDHIVAAVLATPSADWFLFMPTFELR